MSAGWRPAALVHGRRFTALAAGCATLAVVLLVPLAAGTGLDRPVVHGEREQLDAALWGREPGAVVDDVPALYLRAVAGVPPSPPADDAGRRRQLDRARIGQLVALGALAGLVYVAVRLGRGRLQALLATALLAATPPVAAAGAVLRPAVAAGLFGLLAVVLLQVQAAAGPVRRHGVGRAFGWAAVGIAAAIAIGLAIAALPALTAPVLLPGLVLSFAAVLLAVRTARIGGRRGCARLPWRAANRRLLPWTGLALAVPGLVVVVLERTGAVRADTLPAVVLAADLLPAAPPARWVAGGLAVVGAVAIALRLARRWRCGRVGPDVVLFLHTALLLAVVGPVPDPADRLPAAPALAIVQAEGVSFAAAFAGWFAARRRRA
ncbi:MAG: hypothetical protein KF830_05125 [Planctomycetes bacterium]|nr:hypothetical protein [Planctomycetota bacterium]